MKVLILHGPNLNLLGLREPEIYGHETLDEINQQLIRQGNAAGHEVVTFQSNHEGILIDYLQEAKKKNIEFIIFNPAAFTHTSIALRDCLLAIQIPFVEVHLSDISKREAFRQHSYFSDIAQKVIAGFGAQSYYMALASLSEF